MITMIIIIISPSNQDTSSILMIIIIQIELNMTTLEVENSIIEN